MSDIREHPYYPASVTQDYANMQLRVRDEGSVDGQYILPAEATVCPVCNGRGCYVNPSIDGEGLNSEDFEADPDFMESYRNGQYDVECQSCNGRRVILVPTTDGGKTILNRIMDEERSYRAEVAAERRMGA